MKHYLFLLWLLLPAAGFAQKMAVSAPDTVLIYPVAVSDTFPDSLRWIQAALEEGLSGGVKTITDYYVADIQPIRAVGLPGAAEMAKTAAPVRARWVLAAEIFFQKNMIYFHWTAFDVKKPKEVSITLLSERADDPAAILAYPEKMLSDLLKRSGRFNKTNTKKIKDAIQLSRNPKAARWYFAAVSAERRNSALDSAEIWLKRAVQIDSNLRRGYEHLARLYVGQRRYDAAIETYQSLIRADSLSADYYRAVADIYYYHKDQVTLARQYYLQAVKVDPKDMRSWIQSGYCYYVKKEYELAAVQAKKAIAMQPGHAEALNLLGLCAVSLGDTAQALNHFRLAVESDPQEISAKKNLARLYGQRGQTGEALALYQSVVHTDAADALAFLSLAQLYFKKKDTLAAVTAYVQAALLRPDLENPRNNDFQPFQTIIGKRKPADALRAVTDSLTTLLLDAESGSREDYLYRSALGYILQIYLNKPSEAIHHLQMAQLSRPDVARLAYLQAEAFFAMEKYPQALKFYNTYLNSVLDKNNYARTILMIGKTLIRQKRYEEAELEILKSIRLHPNAESYYLYGVILRALQKPDEAAAQFEKAVALYPNYLDAFIDLGQVYQRQNKPSMALSAYQKAAAIDSQNLSLRSAMAALFMAQNNYQEAERHITYALRQAKATGVKTSDFNGLYGEWFYRQKKYDDAAKQFTLQVQSDSNAIEGYYRLACMASIKKDEKNTLKWMELALRKGFMRFSEIDREPAFDNMKKSRKFSDLVYDYRKKMEDMLKKNLK